MEPIDSIAIYRTDKLMMLNLLADYEKKVGHRLGFAKFQKVLLTTYIKYEEDGKHGKKSGKNRIV